ncbi:MAG: Wzt carbohydrate-binding domain-containing protein, partial [Pirellulales bacterium]
QSLEELPRSPPFTPIIRDLEFLDREGHRIESVAAGDGLAVRVHYRSQRPIRDAYFGITLETAEGVKLCWLQTRVQRGRIGDLPPAGTLLCSIPSLPLVPGSYYVTVGCGSQTTPLDFVERCCRLEVVVSDFFGTGRMPNSKQAAVLVKADWQFEPDKEHVRRDEIQSIVPQLT